MENLFAQNLAIPFSGAKVSVFLWSFPAGQKPGKEEKRETPLFEDETPAQKQPSFGHIPGHHLDFGLFSINYVKMRPPYDREEAFGTKLSLGLAKIIRPAAVCKTLVTVTIISSPMY